MRGGDRVQPNVDDGAERGEEQEEAGARERDRGEPAGGQRRAADDERNPAPPRSHAGVAPAPDDERHEKSGRRVGEEGESDQPRVVADPIEEHGEIGGDDSAPEAGGEGRRGEHQQVDERKLGAGRTPIRSVGIGLESPKAGLGQEPRVGLGNDRAIVARGLPADG